METPYYVRDMMKHGCMGYVLKNVDHETLAFAISEIYAGRQYIESTMKEALFQNMLQTKKNTNSAALTQQEKEVLQLIASEFTSQQIADTLFVSLKTVEGHRMSLMHKLGVKNSGGMVKAAMRMGLVE
jgi:DNA-binding NarL/FixJ family response regulator